MPESNRDVEARMFANDEIALWTQRLRAIQLRLLDPRSLSPEEKLSLKAEIRVIENILETVEKHSWQCIRHAASSGIDPNLT